MGFYVPPKTTPLIAIFTGALGLNYILENYWYIAKVDGVSMKPALNPGTEDDYVFIKRCKFPDCKVNRGDIVSLISPKEEDSVLIKRIVGLSGDIVRTHGYKIDVIQVPPNHYWVEGDNIGRSLDSNHFGPISQTKIIGKATHIVWPFSRWGRLN